MAERPYDGINHSMVDIARQGRKNLAERREAAKQEAKETGSKK